MATYESTILSAARAQTATSGSSYAAVTWTVTVAAQIQLQSVTMPIFTADTYTLSIDNVDVATSAATTDATFTLSSPKELAPGSYTFKIRGTASRRYRYRNGIDVPTGTGIQYVAWSAWQEPSGSAIPSVTLNFKIATGVKSADVAATAATTGNWPSQTWDVTLATSVSLTGFIGYFNTLDAYTLQVDGVTVGTGVAGIIPVAPVSLSAGTHQFKLTVSSTRVSYSTTNTRSGSSPATVTGWSAWAENNASPVYVPGSLAFTDTTAPLRTGAFTGSGVFTATVGAVMKVSTSFGGTGAFSAVVGHSYSRGAGFTGAGSFSAEAVAAGIPILDRAADLTGSGSFTADIVAAGIPILDRSGNLDGAGSFTAAALVVPVVVRAGEVAGSGAFTAQRTVLDPTQLEFGSIIRWIFTDTQNGDTVTVPVNPREMSSPGRLRNMQWVSTTGIKGQERSGPPGEWTFTGVLLTKSHYDLLLAWTKRLSVLRVTDHLDRTFEIIIQKFDPIERPRAAYREWRADYTMTCLLLRRIL